MPLPFPNSEGHQSLFQMADEEWAVVFAQAFTSLQGKFVFCLDEKDLHQQLQQLIATKQWNKIYCEEPNWKATYSNTIALESCDAAITGCEFLVARTGSLVLSSQQAIGRTASVYAPVHICVASAKQLVPDIKEALLAMKEKYPEELPSFFTFASGPSRTADIEKTLVTGVHGPKEVFVFLVDD